MDLLNEVPVTLVVKAPNQKVADQTVECALNWTVRKLKEHLSHVYPSNPTENQQKIIYSGKLLQDDVTLKDVLKPVTNVGSLETVHTVHLVCSNSSTELSTSQQSISIPSSSTNITGKDGLRHRHVASSELIQQQQDSNNHQQQLHQLQQPMQPPLATDNSSASTNSVNEHLQYPTSALYAEHYNTFMSHLPSGSVTMGTPPYANSYTAEQIRWLQQQQQAYVQYISNYMQYFQHSAGQPLGQAMPPLATPTIPQNNNYNAGQDQVANAGRQPVAPQQPPVVRMNAQGGPVIDDNDDEMERDWLDWFYVGVRFALLMCILYFYSTPTRFIMTFILMLFIYLFQLGWFRAIGQHRQQGPPPVNPVPPPPPVNPPNADEHPGGIQPPDDPGASVPQEPRPARGLSLVWSVFLSFFTSLAPQPPPAVNAN